MSDEKNRLTPNDVWGNSGNNDVMGEYAAKANLDASEKEGVLLTVCQGKYKEEDLIHIRVNSDLSAGWALTTDSVCFAGNWGSAIIPYEEIVEIIDGTQAFELTQHMRRIPWIFNCRDGKQIVVEGVAVGNEVSNALKRYLLAAKNMCN